MQPAIETLGLKKVFGEKTALADLSLRVEQGEVFGFLGPNGAGKTTAVKILLGLIKPTSGEGKVLAAPLGDHPTRARIGFLPEHFRFHDWLSGTEFLTLHAELNHMPASTSKKQIPELLDLVGLAAYGEKKLRTYSKGMLQRIGLAQALLNNPELVILDEPTSGLDPVGRRLVRDIIRDLRQRGTTVFLNSHFLSEVEVTCDRVAFIKHGQVIKVSQMQTLTEGEYYIEARTHKLNQTALRGLARWSNQVRLEGDRLFLRLSDESEIPLINRYLVENGVDVFSLQTRHISLEDLFIQIVGTDGGL